MKWIDHIAKVNWGVLLLISLLFVTNGELMKSIENNYFSEAKRKHINKDTIRVSKKLLYNFSVPPEGPYKSFDKTLFPFELFTHLIVKHIDEGEYSNFLTKNDTVYESMLLRETDYFTGKLADKQLLVHLKLNSLTGLDTYSAGLEAAATSLLALKRSYSEIVPGLVVEFPKESIEDTSSIRLLLKKWRDVLESVLPDISVATHLAISHTYEDPLDTELEDKVKTLNQLIKQLAKSNPINREIAPVENGIFYYDEDSKGKVGLQSWYKESFFRVDTLIKISQDSSGKERKDTLKKPVYDTLDKVIFCQTVFLLAEKVPSGADAGAWDIPLQADFGNYEKLLLRQVDTSSKEWYMKLNDTVLVEHPYGLHQQLAYFSAKGGVESAGVGYWAIGQAVLDDGYTAVAENPLSKNILKLKGNPVKKARKAISSGGSENWLSPVYVDKNIYNTGVTLADRGKWYWPVVRAFQDAAKKGLPDYVLLLLTPFFIMKIMVPLFIFYFFYNRSPEHNGFLKGVRRPLLWLVLDIMMWGSLLFLFNWKSGGEVEGYALRSYSLLLVLLALLFRPGIKLLIRLVKLFSSPSLIKLVRKLPKLLIPFGRIVYRFFDKDQKDEIVAFVFNNDVNNDVFSKLEAIGFEKNRIKNQEDQELAPEEDEKLRWQKYRFKMVKFYFSSEYTKDKIVAATANGGDHTATDNAEPPESLPTQIQNNLQSDSPPQNDISSGDNKVKVPLYVKNVDKDRPWLMAQLEGSNQANTSLVSDADHGGYDTTFAETIKWPERWFQVLIAVLSITLLFWSKSWHETMLGEYHIIWFLLFLVPLFVAVVNFRNYYVRYLLNFFLNHAK